MRFWKSCACSFVPRSKPNELFLYFIYSPPALLILILFTRFVLSVSSQRITNINIPNGTFIKSIIVETFFLVRCKLITRKKFVAKLARQRRILFLASLKMLNKIPNHHTTATLLANLGFRSVILIMFVRNYFGQLRFAGVMKIFKSLFLLFHRPRLTAMSSSCSSDVSSGATNFMDSMVLIRNPSVTVSAKLEFWRRHFKVFLSNAFLDTLKESFLHTHLQRAIL